MNVAVAYQVVYFSRLFVEKISVFPGGPFHSPFDNGFIVEIQQHPVGYCCVSHVLIFAAQAFGLSYNNRVSTDAEDSLNIALRIIDRTYIPNFCGRIELCPSHARFGITSLICEKHITFTVAHY